MAHKKQSNQKTLLSCQNLSWSIAGKNILRNISLDVSAGDFVGLIGPNGAGKSSLLRCLYRFIRPSEGKITYEQQDIWQLSATEYAQKVAVVLQHTPQHFQLTVTDVVNQGLIPHTSWLSGITSHHQEQVFSALEQVGLLDKKQQPFELLSGGEKQRAMIAKAIVQQTQLLIMDEPTSHLDVKYQIQIMELAKSLGVTVIASFHDLNLASALCDNILVINEGQLITYGTPDDVITENMLSSVFDVCSTVSKHPQHQHPHITYFYGYDRKEEQQNSNAKLGACNE